jgi:hypothetical protein
MAIKEIRLPDGRNVVIDEWLHWPLYSTVEFAKDAGVQLRAFSYVRGQRVPSNGLATRLATQSDTNMSQRQMMSYDESFVMYAITYEAFAISVTDPVTQECGEDTITVASNPALQGANLRRLQRDLEIELILGAGQTKPQLRYTFSYLPQSVGAEAYSNDAPSATNTVSYGTAGGIKPANQRRLELPINIESERQMYLKVFTPFGKVGGTSPDLPQDIRLRFWLDGMKRRPVIT